jgi:hypothetical protein
MPTAYYIPSGPKNLASLFGSINWNDVEEYYLDFGIGTTPHFKMDGCEDEVRVHFLNYLGAIDSIGFQVTIEHETKADSYQRPLTYPLEKAQPGTTRFNVKSNDNYTGLCVLEEEQMQWVAELLDAPLAWLQWEGTQGQADDYIPVVITDQSIVKKKIEERYSYEVIVKFSLSHGRSIIST